MKITETSEWADDERWVRPERQINDVSARHLPNGVDLTLQLGPDKNGMRLDVSGIEDVELAINLSRYEAEKLATWLLDPRKTFSL